uniref:Retrotransposon gag domain-containing protein n=1 Tax=Tanacetum cinerariifolium TaxID=118510 RepID=A0A6L2NNA8_TANCI|nr:hypothetical protein [Tanacetum cinerariifolium]
MADTHTMSELLQAPTEGYRDAIVIPAIHAENFELKVGLLSLTTNLKNDITNFQQRFDETFSEAWDRCKDLLRKCPHHDFSKLHQIDTFYNALTQSDQDSLNAATGGNLLNRTSRDALTIIENKSKVRTSRNKPVVSKVNATTSSSSHSPHITALTDIVKELVLMNKTNQQASVKAIEETCVTCGGPHPYYECLATDSNTFNASAATWTYNQGGFNQGRWQNFNQGNNNYQALNYQAQVGPSNELTNCMKSNEAILRAMQTQMTNMKTESRNEFKSTIDTRTNKIENQNNQIMNILTNLTMQRQSPSGPGSLPSNTVANPRGDLKAITTRSGVAYDGPSIPPTSSSLPEKVERETEATKDKCKLKVQKVPHTSNLRLSNFAGALLYIPKFASTFKSLLSNKEKLFELANTPLTENCSAALLKKLPEKLGDPGGFLIPCDFQGLESCMALADLAGIAEDVFVQVGKFTFSADFIVVDYDKKLLYGDYYKDIDSEKDKNKDSKMKSLVVEAHIVESNDLLPKLLDNDSTQPEEPSESSAIAFLSSSSFGNEDKVFNPGILILGGTQIFNDESKDKDACPGL